MIGQAIELSIGTVESAPRSYQDIQVAAWRSRMVREMIQMESVSPLQSLANAPMPKYMRGR